jgi:hypothetical protein
MGCPTWQACCTTNLSVNTSLSPFCVQAASSQYVICDANTDAGPQQSALTIAVAHEEVVQVCCRGGGDGHQFFESPGKDVAGTTARVLLPWSRVHYDAEPAPFGPSPSSPHQGETGCGIE